ncbi:MAG TPA: Fe-S cluster assembly protein SufD [Vicinamibacterales bacterium]|jgi:Fe-S cluster assembly protein SufD
MHEETLTRTVEGPETSQTPVRASERTRAVARYVSEFERLDPRVSRDQPSWLAEARRAAIARFGELGFPTTRQEAWRFTSVAPLVERVTALAADGLNSVDRKFVESLTLEGVTGLVVFVNGRFAPKLSVLDRLPAGVVVASLKAALRSHSDTLERHLTRGANGHDHPFTELNTAFLDDGAFVSIPAHAVLQAPLQLLFLSNNQSEPTSVSHPRTLIVAGEHCQAQIIERYAGAGDQSYFTNAVTEVVTEREAVVDHYRLQNESAHAFHVGSLHLTAHRASTFSSHSLTLGGSLVRNDVVATLAGEGIDCTLNGLYLGGGTALVDNHTTIDHATAHCGSHEVYKGILWGRARAVFNGKIIVRPDAQKTDAKQTNKALLLSDDAQINTKPELEIFANDVKCTHGAAIGQLDDDAIFYLRSRGLRYDEARAMLIRAFAGDIIQRIKIPALRAELEATLAAELPQAVP